MFRSIRILAALAFGVLTAVVTFAYANPAYAAPYVVACGGSQTTTYNPGLTFTPQTIVRAGQNIHTPCTSTAGPLLFSGSTTFTSTRTLTCLSLTDANTGVDVISWSMGTTSTFTYNRTVTIVAGQTAVTLTGAITSGEFNGATAVETITSVALDLTDCLTEEGLTSTYGVSELTLTG